MLGWLYRLLVGSFTQCRHPTWTVIELNNEQFNSCEHCGFVKPILPPKPTEEKGCTHPEWETLKQGNIVGARGSTPIGTWVHLRCRKCGIHQEQRFQ